MRLCSHRGRGSQGPRFFFLVKKWEILPKAKGLAASFCSSKRYTLLCVWVRTPHITVWECVEKSTRNWPWGGTAPQNADRRETSKQLKIIGPRLDLYWECHTLTPNFETIFRDKKNRPLYRENKRKWHRQRGYLSGILTSSQDFYREWILPRK